MLSYLKKSRRKHLRLFVTNLSWNLKKVAWKPTLGFIEVGVSPFPAQFAAQCLPTLQSRQLGCRAGGWLDLDTWHKALEGISKSLVCFVYSQRVFSCQVFSSSNKNKRLNFLQKAGTFQKNVLLKKTQYPVGKQLQWKTTNKNFVWFCPKASCFP